MIKHKVITELVTDKTESHNRGTQKSREKKWQNATRNNILSKKKKHIQRRQYRD